MNDDALRAAVALVRDALIASDPPLRFTSQAGDVLTIEVDEREYTVLVEPIPQL